jgi:hypothetical protein
MQYLYMESVVDLGFDPYQVKPDFRMSINCFFTKYAVFVHGECGGVKPLDLPLSPCTNTAYFVKKQLILILKSGLT